MKRYHRSFSTLALAATLTVPLAAPGCAARGGSAVAAPEARSFPVTLVAGDVEARAAGETGFTPLGAARGAGASLEIRAAHAGAVVLGNAEDPRAELWLRAGAEARVSEDERGRIVIGLTRGEARARVFDDRRKLTLGQGHEAREAPEDDMLLLAEDGQLARIVPTAEDPGAASFSLDVGSPRPASAAGIGSLEVRTSEDKTARLALRSLRASAELAGDLAETRVEHVFHNDGDERLEGTFRFPLPEDASLVGLSMEIDGKMMDGELVEIDKARKTYETIVDEMRDPALLEWEHGSTFKLRVFPIEPKSDKRIVLRYVAPLRRDLGSYSYVYPTAAPEMGGRIPAFRLDVAGRTVVDRKDFEPAGEIAVPLSDAQRPADVLEERRPDGIYTAVHLRPSWAEVRAALPPAGEPRARRVVIVCDTSRSTLESRPLALDALGAVLGELGPRDRFVVVAADVDQTDHAPEMTPASPPARAAAIHFVEGIEPDGASDLGAALRHAGQLASKAHAADPEAVIQVVYVGDGAPTWGETDPAALHRLTAEALGETPLYAVLLGADVNADLVADLTSIHGGWSARPRSPAAAARFAVQLAHARETASLADLSIDAGEGRTLARLPVRTLLEGDDLVALVRTPPEGTAPTELKLHAKVGDRAIDLRVPVSAASAQRHVARRWAALEIAALEPLADKKDEIVKLSLDYQVMSKKTAFLVLESEEAYAKYQIERTSKAKQQADGKPAVTGGDLESLAARGARLGMDRIQPGDPEILIPAPEDARSVVVVFPFGETKLASFDPQLRQWVVRFLIDAGTPDGTYRVAVRITHHDGRVEMTSVPYVVDTLKPVVTISLRRGAERGQIDIRASQVVGDAEVRSALAPAERTGTVAELRRLYPDRLADVRRVEVRLEDGTVLPLDAHRPGDFRALWTPKVFPEGPVKLHVVAVDKALNQSAFDVEATPAPEVR